MNDWFLIIEGYARLLDVRREDFYEIKSVLQRVPAKFKIKTNIKNVKALVLGYCYSFSLLLIEKTVLEK